jgi:hypothetical protein
MRTVRNTIAIVGVLLCVTGCGQKEKSGAGSRGIAKGSVAREAVYGIRTGNKLGFIMFTDIPSLGASSVADSKWTGHIKPEKGLAVDYKGDTHRLQINGTQYDFDEGRVFLVSTDDGSIAVKQLAIPIDDAGFNDEINRLAETKEVTDFLTK